MWSLASPRLGAVVSAVEWSVFVATHASQSAHWKETLTKPAANRPRNRNETDVTTPTYGTDRSGLHPKKTDEPSRNQPSEPKSGFFQKLAELVLRNNFKTPIGAWVMASIFLLPFWLFLVHHMARQLAMSPSVLAITAVLISGRFV